MTPEERAREALLRCVNKPPWLEEYEPEVARAIREAVEAERRVLLAELDAARAVVELIKAGRVFGRCAICGEMDEHKSTCVIGAYDAAVKASEA